MRTWLIVISTILLTFLSAAHAQSSQETSSSNSPVTVESYYRIKWGELDSFLHFYKKNHQPLLDRMKEQGFIKSTLMQEPYTHMTGDARWDLRVTITYRDADAALFGKEIAAQWKIAQDRLYPDTTLFRNEEKSRFGLVEEHWDVVVMDLVSN